MPERNPGEWFYKAVIPFGWELRVAINGGTYRTIGTVISNEQNAEQIVEAMNAAERSN